MKNKVDAEFKGKRKDHVASYYTHRHVDGGFLNFLTSLGIGTMCGYDGDGWLFQTAKQNLATTWISYSTASPGRCKVSMGLIWCGLTGALE